MEKIIGFAPLHALLVDEDELAHMCRELPESACRAQAYNYGVHFVSLSLTKVGEGLALWRIGRALTQRLGLFPRQRGQPACQSSCLRASR
mgnify:CR=1 FL=1